jgi:diguanylate cyclase (GGDEF)-like protein/PAS domain S-box-containing protein
VRVLLVEDDEDDVILARAMFADIQDLQTQVDWERSFSGALARIERERHDIYLVDYRIGEATGVEWMRAARAKGLLAPIILLTGQGSHEVDIEAMLAGAADYLIDSTQLGRSVRYALDRARYMALIEDNETRYRHLFERVPIPMWAFDAETYRFVAVNDAAIHHYGYSREEFLAMTALDIRPPDTVRAFRDFNTPHEPGYRPAKVWKHVTKDGAVIDVDITAHDVELGGRACRMVLARDVTEQLRIETRAFLLARAFDSSTSGMLILDAVSDDRPVAYVNSALTRMTGYGPDEILGRNSSFLVDQSAGLEGLHALREAMLRATDYEAVMRCKRKDGTIFWAQITTAPVRQGEALTHYVVVATDLTDQRRHEAELTFLARHDPVTGLLRFNGAEEVLQPMLDSIIDLREQVVVFHVDVDNFQAVNDSIGYRGGDETLHILGQRLRYIAGDRGRLWRAGGDEFILAITYFTDEDDPARIAETIREWVEMPVELPSGNLHLSASVGIAIYPTHATAAADLIQCTDAALRRAKQIGRNSTMCFADGHMEDVRDRIALYGRLRHAIAKDELVLHYQPQVRGHDGCIIGMEALVRWFTPDLGLLPPSRFIPLAEDLGMIVEIGRWVLHESCRQARRWLDMGLHDIRIAVNVSALQLHRLSFLDEVCEALDAANLPASLLEIELTETAIMENVERTNQILGGLRDLGVNISLDDFGIGYSCLSQLRNFAIDKLKIDRSFVEGIADAGGGGAITRAIIAMGHELHMKVLAEGVETDAQFGYLRQNHCDDFQGYLFGRPLPAAEATVVLRRRYVDVARFQRDTTKREMLLVDDEPNVLRALARLLRRDGYTIHTATSADEGLDILARQRVQVVVSDQRMPGTSGTEFLSKVKEMYPDTVRIILSGYTDLATVTEAINRGAIYKFLTKPWNADELREQVLEAFRRYDAITNRVTG